MRVTHLLLLPLLLAGAALLDALAALAALDSLGYSS